MFPRQPLPDIIENQETEIGGHGNRRGEIYHVALQGGGQID